MLTILNKNMNNNQQIPGAIIFAGVLIAGAILLKGGQVVELPSKQPEPIEDSIKREYAGLDRADTGLDRTLGNAQTDVIVIEYGDFQCPFCGMFFRDTEGVIIDKYVRTGKVKFVYRDFAFLGPESIKAALAARCAGDQGKFWEYHDYLFSHQNGENQGAFADPNLKSFARTLRLNTSMFGQCFDSLKHHQEILDSLDLGKNSGVKGTPKGFILKDGKIVDTIDGAEPTSMVTDKIEKALK